MRLIDADGAIYIATNHLINPYEIISLRAVIDKTPSIAPEGLVKHGEWIEKPIGAYGRQQSLLTCIRTILLFALLSICAGPAIWLIAKFIDMLGPVLCAAIVMLELLGWAVCKWMEDLDIK